MAADRDATPETALGPGSRVEVRDGFEGHWQRGFVVDATVDGGFRVRRTSDDSVLPSVIDATAVRPERKRSMWWI